MLARLVSEAGIGAEMAYVERNAEEEPASMELLLVAAMAQGYLETLKPRDRPKVLARVAEILQGWAEPSPVVPLWWRSHPATAENARAAIRWLNRASLKLLSG